jgi:hypothetical protein
MPFGFRKTFGFPRTFTLSASQVEPFAPASAAEWVRHPRTAARESCRFGYQSVTTGHRSSVGPAGAAESDGMFKRARDTPPEALVFPAPAVFTARRCGTSSLARIQRVSCGPLGIIQRLTVMAGDHNQLRKNALGGTHGRDKADLGSEIQLRLNLSTAAA